MFGVVVMMFTVFDGDVRVGKGMWRKEGVVCVGYGETVWSCDMPVTCITVVITMVCVVMSMVMMTLTVVIMITTCVIIFRKPTFITRVVVVVVVNSSNTIIIVIVITVIIMSI